MGIFARICPECNYQNEPNDNFCIKCGKSLENVMHTYVSDYQDNTNNGHISIDEEKKTPVDKIVYAVIGFFVLVSIVVYFEKYMDSDGYVEVGAIKVQPAYYNENTSIEYSRATKKDDSLYVYVKFYNNSDIDLSCNDCYSTIAFQNGVELDQFYWFDDEHDAFGKKILPGKSIEVVYIFVLEDDSDIVFKTYKWGTDELVFKETLSLE